MKIQTNKYLIEPSLGTDDLRVQKLCNNPSDLGDLQIIQPRGSHFFLGLLKIKFTIKRNRRDETVDVVRGNGFVPADFGTSGCWQGLACASKRRTRRGPILGVVAGTTIKEIPIS